MGIQTHRNLLFLTALVLAPGAAIAPAQNKPAQNAAQLAELRLGDHWYAAEATHDDLRGKVVLVEYWGS
jgi:hypothetical protein